MITEQATNSSNEVAVQDATAGGGDSTKPILKTSFTLAKKIESIFTGGKIEASRSGDLLACSCNEDINIIELGTGLSKCKIKTDSGTVTSFALHPSGEEIVTSHASLQFQHWTFGSDVANLDAKPELKRRWKFDGGLNISATYDPSGTLLAVGATDNSVRVWDVPNGYCTHFFRKHTDIVTIVVFHPKDLKLFSSGEDGLICMWDLKTQACVTFKNHLSRVTSLAFSPSCSTLISGGRDRVISVWDLSTRKLSKTFPVYSIVESLVYLTEPYSSDTPNKPSSPTKKDTKKLKEDDAHQVLISGPECPLTVVDLRTGTKVHQLTGKHSTTTENSFVNQILFCQSKLLAVTSDHFLQFYSFPSLTLEHYLVGFNDEILDLRYAGLNKLVVATNSENVRVYDLQTHLCGLLKGHTDIVIALDMSKDGNFVVTGAKDHTVKVWDLRRSIDDQLIAECQGHSMAITALSLAPKSGAFVATASVDKTIKEWDLKTLLTSQSSGDSVKILSASTTVIAHEKEMNSLVISPNERLIASASEDRTIRLWTRENPARASSTLVQKSILRGHKKSVWSVGFSPVDRIIASASADSTVRVWSIDEGVCLRTLEGHSNTVLRIGFISSGMQLISAGSEGLVKIWTLRTGECTKTIEAHDGKIWALAIRSDEAQIALGSVDSKVTLWNDATEQETLAQAKKLDELVLQQQLLSNALNSKDYTRAIMIATRLKQPKQLFDILEKLLDGDEDDRKKDEGNDVVDIIDDEDDIDEEEEDGDKGGEGERIVVGAIQKLNDKEKKRWLKFAREWNTNARHCFVAQRILGLFLKMFPPSYFSTLPKAKALIEGILPYTFRHSQRIERLMVQSYFLDHVLSQMKSLVPIDDIEAEDSDADENLPDVFIDGRKLNTSSRKKKTKKIKGAEMILEQKDLKDSGVKVEEDQSEPLKLKKKIKKILGLKAKINKNKRKKSSRPLK